MGTDRNSAPARRLQKARERAGFTSAEEVAASFGWPGYAEDEAGGRDLTETRAKVYAHAFHVDVAWLMSGNTGPADEAGSRAGPAPDDDLPARIARLTPGQRSALEAFLRAMQDT